MNNIVDINQHLQKQNAEKKERFLQDLQWGLSIVTLVLPALITSDASDRKPEDLVYVAFDMARAAIKSKNNMVEKLAKDLEE